MPSLATDVVYVNIVILAVLMRVGAGARKMRCTALKDAEMPICARSCHAMLPRHAPYAVLIFRRDADIRATRA